MTMFSSSVASIKPAECRTLIVIRRMMALTPNSSVGGVIGVIGWGKEVTGRDVVHMIILLKSGASQKPQFPPDGRRLAREDP